jgi:hypothetical protein
MPTKKEQPTITLPLSDFVWDLLGDEVNGIACTSITEQTAIILQHLLKDSLLWKVEFNDKEGNPLKSPLLWRYKEWRTSSDTYHRQKKYDYDRRIKLFIKEKNVDNIARSIMKDTKMSIEQARPIAAKLLEKGNLEVIQYMGVSRIITKEEEL